MVTGKTCSSQQLTGFDIQVLYPVLSGYSILTPLQGYDFRIYKKWYG
jgi:hypothetical protein